MVELVGGVGDDELVAAGQDVELHHVPGGALQPRRQLVQVAAGLDDAVADAAALSLGGAHRGLNPTPV